MRQSLVQAMHHTKPRIAFQKRSIQQPLMKNTLADMAIEVEAALAIGLRVARAMDNSQEPSEAAFARVGTTLAKYWNTKRCPPLVVEALECHGGPGYVEESIMPRLYREAPLNSIWEGSGNVMGLDVLRVISREPEALSAFLTEVQQARSLDDKLDSSLDLLKQELDNPKDMESRMRMISELMALTLQGTFFNAIR